MRARGSTGTNRGCLVHAIRDTHHAMARAQSARAARALDRFDIPPCCARALRSGRAAIAALLCAGFPLGALNTNVCPPGSSKIATDVACASAARALGDSISAFCGATPDSPSGCYKANSVCFNDHPTGGTNAYAQPLCAGAPTRPRSPHSCACACVFLCACVCVCLHLCVCV